MLLKEGIEQQYVIPTEYTRKLTLDGITNSYQVYKIRLDKLYFNDQNDRIATWINKYKVVNNVEQIDISNEQYNDIVEQFIYESNPKAIDKTKNNISLVGQREAGVVLNDGRIIDGNRRFTCLRRIEKESEQQYFEAVILDSDIQSNEKAIKLLELSIQHGEEGRIDYNPIDKLVGIYQDIIKNKLITVEEYSKTVNESVSSIQKKMEQAQLMNEFLEFIHAKEQFYIARDLELDGPLQEMQTMLRKVKNTEEHEELKIILFNNILMKPQGDISRFVRKMKEVIVSEHFSEFVDEQMSFVKTTVGKLDDVDKVDSQFINKELRTADDLKEEMKVSVEKFEKKIKTDSSRLKPIDDIAQCRNYLENIDLRIVKTFSDNEKTKFEQLLKKCNQLLNEIQHDIQ